MHVVSFFHVHRLHIAMSFIIANNYIRQKGRSSIIEFLRLCNEGKTLSFMAQRFGVSVQRISILRKQLFKEMWVYQDDTLEALKFERGVAEDAIREIDESVGSDGRKRPNTAILRLPVDNRRA